LAASDKIRVPVLLGPTASGKSAFAVELCRRLGLDLLSCDSRQIYRGMDIGTAKPSGEDLARVRHWMIDIVNPDVRYSAHEFAAEALRIIRERAARGTGVLVCGGSGLYYQALSGGLGPSVAADPAVRDSYHALAQRGGKQAVFDRLVAVDPVTAAASHVSNLQRNIRALEVFHATGKPFSQLKQAAQPPADMAFEVVLLSPERKTLYQRIDSRVDAMMKQGLLDEFRTLRERGYAERSPGMLCVGYREFFAFERNEESLDSAVDMIKQDTRNYAKRQITWFRHQVKGRELTSGANAVADLTEIVSKFLTA